MSKLLVIHPSTVMQIANLPQSENKTYLAFDEEPSLIEITGFSPSKTNYVVVESPNEHMENGEIAVYYSLQTGILFKNAQNEMLGYRISGSELERMAIGKLLRLDGTI